MTPPFTPLSAWFRGISARALSAEAAAEDVLEALAGAAGVAVLSGLDDVGTGRRRELVRKGRRTILAAGPGRRRDEEAEDLRGAINLAKAGLAALDGDAPTHGSGLGDPMHPPDGRLSAATLGELDGFSLASCALHVAGCAECAKRLAVLRMAGTATSSPLRVAAATAVAMREPDAGRVVCTIDTPSAEVVLFDDEGECELAVYAEDSVPVRLVAEGLSTIEMLAGYWLGALSPDATRILGKLHIGDAVIDVEINVRT